MARKRRNASAAALEDGSMDMSPMIDMVFQLIIFFMVTASLVTLKKDPDVLVPVAPKGKRSDSAAGRVLVNVYSDDIMKKKGHNSPFADESGKELAYDQISDLVRAAKERNDGAGIKPTILLLRGDRVSLVRRMKEAIQAAGDVGVNDVIFAAYQDNYTAVAPTP